MNPKEQLARLVEDMRRTPATSDAVLLAILIGKYTQRLDAILATLPEPGVVPEGYALVPVEPTAAMVNAAANYDTGSSDGTVGRFCAGEIWYLMLAAAPSPEQEK